MKADAKSPKDGAQRQREFKKRQRAAGKTDFRAWISNEEAEMLKKLLACMRKYPHLFEKAPAPSKSSIS